MTPDAVLYRYTLLMSARDIRVDELYDLISLDAGLLGEWLHGLNCEVDPQVIKAALKQLDSSALKRIALGQTWAVAPPANAPRLEFDQWRALVLCSFLAASLAREQGYSDPEAARLKILLALSGISVTFDSLMSELTEFRGCNLDLLQDAHPVLRYFAVVDSYSSQGVEEASRTAELLLGLNRQNFQQLLEQAAAESNTLVDKLAIAECSADKWQEPLWLQARLASFANLLAHQADLESLALVHQLISGSLFQQVPPCFLLDPRENMLLSIGNGFFKDIPIHALHSQSVLARALRERRTLEVFEGEELLVVDRQLMRRLDATTLHVVPLLTAMESVGVLVFKSSPQTNAAIEKLAQLYADEFAHWLLMLRENQWQSSQLLDEYRSSQEKRLREIVHEANNPLSIIHNYLHILELRLQHESGAREQLNMIAEEIRRTAEIVKRVVDFPSPDEVAKPVVTVTRSRFDLNKLAAKVLELVKGQASAAGVELEQKFYPGEVVLFSDVDSVTQAMTNLVKNAVEAMPEGGKIEIETLTGVYRSGRAGVEFVVRDDGPGLPAEVIQHLYEPKGFTRGSGLGLHITSRLVAELEGALDLRTSPAGTAFSVFLPNLEA